MKGKLRWEKRRRGMVKGGRTIKRKGTKEGREL